MAEKCGCEYHPQRSHKFDHCRNCSARKSATEHISTRGYCLACAIERESSNARQLAARRGEYFEKFAAGMIRYAQHAQALVTQSSGDRRGT